MSLEEGECRIYLFLLIYQYLKTFPYGRGSRSSLYQTMIKIIYQLPRWSDEIEIRVEELNMKTLELQGMTGNSAKISAGITIASPIQQHYMNYLKTKFALTSIVSPKQSNRIIFCVDIDCLAKSVKQINNFSLIMPFRD